MASEEKNGLGMRQPLVCLCVCVSPPPVCTQAPSASLSSHSSQSVCENDSYLQTPGGSLSIPGERLTGPHLGQASIQILVTSDWGNERDTEQKL